MKELFRWVVDNFNYSCKLLTSKPLTRMKNQVFIPLNEPKEVLAGIFSYSQERYGDLTQLATYIAHYYDQTLRRDGFDGAWAQVLLNDKGEYILKLFCEKSDLGAYEEKIPAFIQAAKIGLETFMEIKPALNDVGCAVEFLLPFGLSLIHSNSIQLLHYPPLESLVYHDYLYSPTNRRYENLLAFNDTTTNTIQRMETIVDCVPLAAPGDDGNLLKPYNNSFADYGMAMLRTKLNSHRQGEKKQTQCVVAYGSAVVSWLKLDSTFGPQLKGIDTSVLSLVHLDILNDGSTTPVLIANHPSKMLYYTDSYQYYVEENGAEMTPKEYATNKMQIMTQDLITAGWHAEMAQNPLKDPQKVLDSMCDYWNNHQKKVADIVRIQDLAFSYNGLMTEINYNKTQDQNSGSVSNS